MVGILAGTDSLRRGFAGFPMDATTFYVVPLTDMLLFATLFFPCIAPGSIPPRTSD